MDWRRLTETRSLSWSLGTFCQQNACGKWGAAMWKGGYDYLKMKWPEGGTEPCQLFLVWFVQNPNGKKKNKTTKSRRWISRLLLLRYKRVVCFWLLSFQHYDVVKSTLELSVQTDTISSNKKKAHKITAAVIEVLLHILIFHFSFQNFSTKLHKPAFVTERLPLSICH